MQDKNYSSEALTVLEEGKKIWQAYFALSFPHSIREKFKLGRADVGYYQIHKALKALAEMEYYSKHFSLYLLNKPTPH
ncbi:MAG: hypothetical protein ACTTKH_05310 [Treponema sp.]